MSTNVGSAVGYLDLDIQSFMTKLSQAQQGIANTKTKSEGLASTLTSVGSGFTKAGTALSVGVTAPIVALGTSVINTGKQFTTGMSQIQATMGITSESTFALDSAVLQNNETFQKFANQLDLTDTSAVNTSQALELLARQLGSDTKYSATECADAINILAMAGKDTNEIMGMLPSVLTLASAGAMDIGAAADYATGIMAGFGMETAETNTVCNTLAMMASSAKGSVTQFGEAMSTCAGQASVTGQSFETTAVALEILGNHNLSASEAGNALNRTLKNLYQPSTTGAKAMDAIGLSAYDAAGNARPLNEVLMDLKGKLNGLSEEEYNNVLNGIFDAATLKSVPFLINDCTEAWDTADDSVTSLVEGIRGANDAYDGMGAAAGQAQVQIDNLEGDIAIMGSAFDELKISLFQSAESPLRGVIQKVTELIQWFNGLSNESKKMIVKFAAIAAAIGPLLIIIGKLCTGLGSMITFFGKVPGVVTKVSGVLTKLPAMFGAVGASAEGAGAAAAGGMAAISAPVLAVVAVIAVLVAAFAHLWKTNEDFRNKIISIWEGITTKFKEAFQKITDAINSLGFDFENLGQAIYAAWDWICNALAPIITAIFQNIAVVIGGVVDIIVGVVQVICGIIKGFKDGDWTLFLEGLKSLFTGFLNLITAPFQAIWNVFTGYLEQFGTSWEEIWGGISDFFVNLWNGIVSFFSGIWDTISNVVQVGIMLIGEILNAAFEIITLPFRFIWENCKEYIIGAWEEISGTVTTVLTAISEFLSSMWTTISNVASTAWRAISSFFTTIWTGIKTVCSTIWNEISGFFVTIWETISGNVSSAVNEIKETITSVWNSISSTFKSILNGMKNTVTNVFSNIKSFIGGVVSWLKGIFNFSWSLPPIKLPHISIEGSFGLNPPSVPHFSISWYKKAMEKGMIMNEPTIFGFDAASGKFLAGGEAGSETVVGTGSLMEMIQSAVTNAMSSLMAGIQSLCAGVVDAFTNVTISLNDVIGTMSDNLSGATLSQEIVTNTGNAVGTSSSLDMMIVEEFKKAISEIKINNNVNVEMTDGDVYLDRERVGRSVAPVVSRLIANNM